MKKKFLALLTTMVVGASVGVFASCNKPSDESSTPTTPDSSSSVPVESFATLENFTLGFGETKRLEAVGDNLVWSSSDPNVATVSETGEVLGVGLGEATISVSNGVEMVSCTVVVAPSSSVPSLELDISQRTVGIGETHTISPVVTIEGVVLNYVQFTYTMDDPSIATVDANGVIRGVSIGTTTLYVAYNAGGYEDGVEITVVVSEDVIFEVNHQYITLCAKEVAGGTYSSTANVEVTQLRVGGQAVDVSDVTFSVEDETIATVSGGVVTAKTAGETILTASYDTGSSTITVDVPVYVVRERVVVADMGRVDKTWDATTSTPKDYAYIELPMSLQIADEEVSYVKNKMGTIFTEEQGLTIPKSRIEDGTQAIIIGTTTLEYELTIESDTSFIKVTDYGNHFADNIGVKAKALGEEMDGRNDVVIAQSPKETPTAGTGVWYNHNGYIRFGNYQKSWKRGVFVFDVKAATGTPLGGYYSTPGASVNFALDTSTMKFNKEYIKVVSSNFTETTFKYGQWNTVVVDYTQISAEEFTCNFMPSFTNTDYTTQYTAYYSNLRYMTKEAYEKLSNPAVEKKYTVEFDMGDSNMTIPAQQVSFRGRVNVPNVSDEHQFIGWAINGQMVDLAKLHVTKDITVTAVYDKEYQYTIKHFQRQINGAYKLVDTEVLEGKMAALVTATPKTYAGYVFNADLSVISGNVQVFDGLVLACYYENTSYEFETQEIGGHANLTITQKTMNNAPYEDLRGNTYLYQKSKADGNTMNAFTYTPDKVGKYLVFNVYYTEISNALGVEVWGNGTDTPVVTNQVVKGMYNVKGKEIAGKTEALSNWVSLVIYLDPSYFSTSKDSFYMTLCSWSANTLYYGEYTYLTQTQVDSFFKASEGPYEEGVLAYAQDEITYHNGLISIDSAKAYAANSRVAIRARNNKGAEMKMYASDGSTKISASEIYTDDGKIAKTFTANTWYTYIFYIDGKITIEGSAGKMFVDTTASDMTVEYSSAYIIDSKFTCANFRFKAFELQGASGVDFYHAYHISRISTANCGVHTQYDDGTILLESTDKSNEARRYFLDDLETMEKGSYVAWKLKYEDTVPNAIFYGANGAGVDCTTFYDEDKNPIASVSNAQKGKWVYVVWQVTEDIDGPICDNASSSTPGTFTLIKDAPAGAKVVIGGAYVMTASGYNAFFHLS